MPFHTSYQILKDRALANELEIPHLVVPHSVSVAEQMEIEAIEDVRILRDQVAEIARLERHDVRRDHDDDLAPQVFDLLSGEKAPKQGNPHQHRNADPGALLLRG